MRSASVAPPRARRVLRGARARRGAAPSANGRRARRAPPRRRCRSRDASRSAAARDAFAAARRVASLRAASTEARSAAGAPVGRVARRRGARLFFLASSLRRSALATSARALVRAGALERPSSRAGAVAVHGAHTSGRSGLCAAYRAGTGYGSEARSERKKRQCHVRSAISGTPRKARVRRGSRGARSATGGGGRRRAATAVSGVQGASTRARSGRHGRHSEARRGSSASGGGPGERPEGNGHVRHLVFPGKMFERPRSRGGAETDLAAWTRRVAARARRRTRHGTPSRPLGSGAGASPCAPRAAPRGVRSSIRIRASSPEKISRAISPITNWQNTLGLFFFQ